MLTRRLFMAGGASALLHRAAFAAANTGDAIGEWHLPNGKVLRAYSNGPNAGTDNGHWKWQCVELVRNHFRLTVGKEFPSIGYAYKLFGRVAAGESAFSFLQAFQNERGEPPRVGDVLCFSGKTAGHVAVVTAVGESSIAVIEQNWRRETAVHSDVTYARAGNVYVVNSRSGYTCQGWVRMRDFTFEQPRLRQVRVTCLIVDTSESIKEEGRIGVVGQLVRRYVELQGADDLCALVLFNTFGRYRFGFKRAQEVLPDLDDTIARITPSGRTNIGAGLHAAATRVPDGSSPHFLLVSDGGENEGRYDDVLQEYIARKWRVSTFIFGQRAKREVLRDIAVQTGGKYVDAGRVEPLTAFTALVRAIQRE